MCGAQCCRAPGWFLMTGDELNRLSGLAEERDMELLIHAGRDDGLFVLDHKTNGDACPFLKARHHADLDLPDPRDMDEAGYRAVRDLIEGRVRELVGVAAAR